MQDDDEHDDTRRFVGVSRCWPRSRCARCSLAAQNKVRIIQTNSAGDNVHLIDPATNKVVGVIDGIEVNHGAGVAPDGSRIYISNEAESTLDFVDAKTLKVIKKVPLSGHPTTWPSAATAGACMSGSIQAPGGVDVIDTASIKRVKTIPTQGHHPQCRTSRRTASTSWPARFPGKTINVIDAQTEKPAWTLKMDLGVRPMTFVTNPDGSTKWIFVQLSGLNGFAVVDFATRKEIKRIENPPLPPGKTTVPGRIRSVSRHGGHLGRQDARRLQPVEQLPLLRTRFPT